MWQYLDDQEAADVEARLEDLGDTADGETPRPPRAGTAAPYAVV
jgi:hypothetical protein